MDIYSRILILMASAIDEKWYTYLILSILIHRGWRIYTNNATLYGNIDRKFSVITTIGDDGIIHVGATEELQNMCSPSSKWNTETELPQQMEKSTHHQL